MPVELKSLSLSGYKTFRELTDFEPGRLSVLVGGNGSGKSNFLSFFGLLRSMTREPGELQLAVAKAGGAGRLFHDGPKISARISARLCFEGAEGEASYELDLMQAADGALSYRREKIDATGLSGKTVSQDMGEGHPEARLPQRTPSSNGSSLTETEFWMISVLRKLQGCVLYHFQNTSFNSTLRAKSSIHDDIWLHRDGSNLPAILLRLRDGSDTERAAYKRIQDILRISLPFFAAFELSPENDYLLLRWREVGSEQVFSVSQASDGMLRLVTLVTLLCQPEGLLPPIILLDEPELGLHPQAITLLASLIRKASHHSQIIVATQSAALVDEFTLDEIVVARRSGRETKLERLNEVDYSEWRNEYSTGELWSKNVFGGGPGE